MNKNLLRWMPAVIAPAAVVAAATVPTVAGAAPQLPDKSPQELLAFIAESDETTFSGTIEQTSDLGLPELPSSGSPHGNSDDGAAGALEMLTESHRAQVHVGDDEQLRIQVMERMSQRDIIINDGDIWLYDSRAGEAKHLELPDHSGKHADKADGKTHGLSGMPGHHKMQGVHTPAELADRALAKVTPSTDVTVSGTASIAGRSAYELTLTPKTDETLIGSVTLGVDSETGLPLSFEITARGETDPAYSVAFTDIDFSTPPDSLFEFTPPDSATVTEVPAKQHQMSKQHKVSGQHHARDGEHHAPGTDNGMTGHMKEQRPTVIGEGWSSIVSLPADAAFDGAADSSQGQATLQQLMRPVDGGQVLQTELVSVFITDDGRVLVGAVSAESLMAAAAR